MGNLILLVGPAGCGKSKHVQHLSSSLGIVQYHLAEYEEEWFTEMKIRVRKRPSRKYLIVLDRLDFHAWHGNMDQFSIREAVYYFLKNMKARFGTIYK